MHTEELMVEFDREMRALDRRVHRVSFEAESREEHHTNANGDTIGAFRVSVTCYDPPDSYDNMTWQDGVGVSLEDALAGCRAKMRSWVESEVEARRARDACVVCGAPYRVTTGEGKMCQEHGMRWLAGEASVSEMLEESEERDMG